MTKKPISTMDKNARPEPFWIDRISAGKPARLREVGESTEHYRIAMGWDAPNPSLEPCPHCGSAARIRQCTADNDSKGGHFIECENRECGASSVLMFSLGTDVRPLLAERWNRRTSAGQQWGPILDALDGVSNDLRPELEKLDRMIRSAAAARKILRPEIEKLDELIRSAEAGKGK